MVQFIFGIALLLCNIVVLCLHILNSLLNLMFYMDQTKMSHESDLLSSSFVIGDDLKTLIAFILQFHHDKRSQQTAKKKKSNNNALSSKPRQNVSLKYHAVPQYFTSFTKHKYPCKDIDTAAMMGNEYKSGLR